MLTWALPVVFSSVAGCDGVTQGQVLAEIDCVICLVRSVWHIASAAESIEPLPHCWWADCLQV